MLRGNPSTPSRHYHLEGVLVTPTRVGRTGKVSTGGCLRCWRFNSSSRASTLLARSTRSRNSCVVGVQRERFCPCSHGQQHIVAAVLGVTCRHQFLYAQVNSLVKIILGCKYFTVSDGRRGYLYKCRASDLQVILSQGLLGFGKQYLGFFLLVLLFFLSCTFAFLILAFFCASVACFMYLPPDCGPLPSA